MLSSSRYHRADVSDPAPAIKVLDELKQARAELAKALPAPEPKPEAAISPQSKAWREKSHAYETFGGNWRKHWFADGLAFRPEAGDGFPHSGREARKLVGALRSPTFTIEDPYLFIRVAGRDAKARLVLNGLQLIQAPIYGGLAQPINHGEELRWMAFDLRMWKGQPAYLELLDDGPGWFAISEMWFADGHPPAEPGAKVPLPDAPATDKTGAGPEEPAGDSPEKAKKLADRVRELEAKLPDPRRARRCATATDWTSACSSAAVTRTPARSPRARRSKRSASARSTRQGSGRLELARTVTDPANPLVARVLVNRLWKHHFGEGIVRSPDDFGLQGQLPTHPELLDWLASEFVDKKWSLKTMHRLMLLSTAYRQSSRATPEQSAKAVTADPQNRLLHRQNVKRLEAEAIRDSILAVSGRLDLKMEGPGTLPHLTDHQVGRGRPASGPLDGDGRRSIYLQVRRNFLNPMFTAFDYPTPFTTIGRRTVSNVPAQALVMLNNPFVIQQAELWSKRVLAVPSLTPDERVTGMYQSAFGRPPAKDELATATAFVAEQATEYGKPDHPKAWADLAHVLLNAKEFIFVE